MRHSFGFRTGLAVGGLALACGQKQSEVPRVEPSGVLERESQKPEARGPMRVVHSGPHGQATSRPTIQVLFSQPLREVGVDVPVPTGLVVEPDPGGHFEWLGTRALVYVPEGGELPLSTHFRVTVPAGVASLSGERSTETHRFEFNTPLPEVTAASPRSYDERESRTQEIRLTFSQPVDPARILEFFEAKAGGEQRPVRAGRGKNDQEVVFLPIDPWPLGARVEYSLRPGFPGKVGPLPADKSFDESFQVYGPLVARVECDRDRFDRCRPGSYMSVSFSSPVPAQAFAQGLSAGDYPLHVDRSFSPEDRTLSLYLSPTLKPGQTFELKFAPGLRDIFGQPLSSFAHSKVVVGDYRPSVTIGFSGNSIPTREKAVAVLSQNAPYSLWVAPLEASEVMQIESSSQPLGVLEKLPRAVRRSIPARVKNQAQSERVDLETLLTKSQGRGAFALGVRFKDESGETRESVQWAQRTDLALTAKLGRQNTQAWVTDLITGAPIQGAKISFVEGDGTDVVTDAQGLAQLPPGKWLSSQGHERKAEWIRVEHGTDVVLRSNRETVDGYFLPVPTDYYGSAQDRAFLFAERDLLRPGDAFWIKGYVRRLGLTGNAVLSGQEYRLVLLSPEGAEVQSKAVRSSDFGSFSARLQVPLTAPLGYFQVVLRKGKSELAQTHLQVAEYVPAEFKAEVTPRANAHLRGEQAWVSISGSYLYGAPMAGAVAHATVFRYPTTFTPPGAADLVTDDLEYQDIADRVYQTPYINNFELKFDQTGAHEIEVPLKFENMVGPERVETEAEIVDLSNRAQAARSAFLVHPARYYLGLERPREYFVESGSNVTPSAVALEPSGATVKGRDVTLALYRVRYAEVVRKGSDGEPYSVSERIQEKVATCHIQSEVTPRGCALRTKNPGFHVVRATSRDERGREVSASYSFYVLGSGPAGFAHMSDRQEVELTLDKESYRVGERARLLIQSPFKKGRAWITVEKDDAVESYVVPVEGAMPTFDLPVTDRFRPNAHIGVVLIEDGGSAAPPSARADSYRIGYTELRLDPEPQRLRVQVQADQASYRPRSEVSLDFTVRNAEGRPVPAELSVFVVDEGVLLLSGQELPDPLRVFTAPEPLRVETLEGRQWVARLFGFDPADYSAKGDPGGGGEDGRSSFLTTAYFNPSLLADANGHARATFKLPDNIGQFRVTAMAVSRSDQYGTGKASLTVNQELMIRPQLPRFLRSGDSFAATALVSSLSKKSLDVRVSLGTKGAKQDTAQAQGTFVEAARTGRIDFLATAGAVGKLAFDFSGKAEGLSDRVLVDRTVQSPARIETVAAYGKTTDAAAERLGSLEELRPDVGGLSVTLSATALSGLRASYESLIDYPYACTEQLGSRVLPLLALDRLASHLDLPVPKDAKGRVGHSVQQILQRQRGDGGFGMWPDAERSDPFVSAYALFILHLAKRGGFFIPEGAFLRGRRYLAEVAKGDEPNELAASVFATFVLAELGAGDPARVNTLYENRAKMPPFARSFLLWSAAITKQKNIVQPLLREVEASLVLRGDRVELSPSAGAPDLSPFSSPVRSHAITLGAMLAAQPKHPLLDGLVRSLLDQRRNGSWGSTQESAFSLLSLALFHDQEEPQPSRFDARLFVGGRETFRRSFGGGSLSVTEGLPMRALLAGSDLVFSKEGSGILYYEARLRYARAELPQAPFEAGFAVTKSMRPVSREDLFEPSRGLKAGSDTSAFHEGDLVLVEVQVLAPDPRRFVVVDDPLPAGLEAVDLSLKTGTSHLSVAATEQDGFSSAWYRRELRDDRVLHFVDDMPAGLYRYVYLARATTPGTFVTPPTMALEMYQDEVFGRTGARMVTIASLKSP